MKGTDKGNDRGRDKALEELFRHATVRERPPPHAEQAVRESLREDWRRSVTRRRRRRYVLAAAAAASIALVFVIAGPLLPLRDTVEPGVRVAEVERLQGRVSLQATADASAVEVGTPSVLETGQLLSTAHRAGVAVRWHNGIELRIDQNSRVRLESPGGVAMEAGRIYIDTSEAVDGDSVLEVQTPIGPIRHHGTRYMVAVQLGTTRVSVREGSVLLVESGVTANSGERLVAREAGGPRRESVSVNGEAWAWADELAEPVSTGGRSVAELLAWAGRETARSVEFESDEAEQLAQETRLVGDVAVDPVQALVLISQSTDLVAEVVAGVIVVRLDAAP